VRFSRKVSVIAIEQPGYCYTSQDKVEYHIVTRPPALNTTGNSGLDWTRIQTVTWIGYLSPAGQAQCYRWDFVIMWDSCDQRSTNLMGLYGVELLFGSLGIKRSLFLQLPAGPAVQIHDE
jgi:hypothetical protein